MRTINFLLTAALLILLSVQATFAGDFQPDAGELYSIQIKGHDLVIGPNASKKATLQPFLKQNHSSYAFIMEEADGGYRIKNESNEYLYYSGYTMTFVAGYTPSLEQDGSKGYLFDFIYDEANEGYRLCAVKNGNRFVASDNIGSGESVYSDKPQTHANGVFLIVKSSEIKYDPKFAFDSDAVQIEFGKGATADEGKGLLQFTVYNYSGIVKVAVDDSGFTLSETECAVEDGVAYSLTVTSTKEIGTKATLTFSSSENVVMATIPVEVVKPSPRYYIINVESGLVIGGETFAVLSEREKDPSQYFLKVPVKGTADTYYLIQESSGNYLKKVEEGVGVYNFLVELGAQSKAEWKFPANGAYCGLKNTSCDRILMPDGNQLVSGGKLLLYGLNSDIGTKWELIDVANLESGEPWIEVLDENIIVEKNGLTFSTQIRALNLGNKTIDIEASEGVKVSLSSLSEGFDYKEVTISSSAEPGTQCSIKFLLDGKTMKTIEFTVQKKFERYIIRAHQLKPKAEIDPETGEPVIDPETGEPIEPEPLTELAIGNEENSLLPVLKELDAKDPSQYFLFVPVSDSTCYIVQDGTFRYFAKYEGDHWQTTLEPSTQREWWVNKTDPDSVIIRNMYNFRSLGVNKYEVGERIATDRGDCGWILEALGRMDVNNSDIILEDKNATAEVTIECANLKEDIAVVASEGFKVDKDILPKEGGKLVISSDDGTALEGTVALKSGIYSTTIRVRMKHSELKVSKEALAMSGKGATDMFVVTGTDWESEVKIEASEGLAVNVTTIAPAISINQAIIVSYTGRKSTEGTITVESGNYKKEIPVTVTIDSKIVVSDTELSFEDDGSAYFRVDGQDLFEKINITSSSEQVSVEPAELEADVMDGYVFLQYEEGVPQYDVTITLTSGDVTQTVKVKGKDGATGIQDEASNAIQAYVNDGTLYVSGIPVEAEVVITDIVGKQIHIDSLPYELPANGIYIVHVLEGQKSLKVFKVVR
ncbi:hypothetical protein [Bacteroides sp.]